MKTSSSGKRATTERAGRLPGRLVFALVVLAVLAACGHGEPPSPQDPASAPAVASGPPIDFRFDSLDERPVSSEATRGELTLLEFLTTSSLPSQAQVDFLVAMARHDADKVHYAAVAVEGPDERELVELYRKTLGIPFPVALVDAQTLAGIGAFGDVHAVPVTVLLDREGRVLWRAEGRVAKSDELRAVMRGR